MAWHLCRWQHAPQSGCIAKWGIPKITVHFGTRHRHDIHTLDNCYDISGSKSSPLTDRWAHNVPIALTWAAAAGIQYSQNAAARFWLSSPQSCELKRQAQKRGISFSKEFSRVWKQAAMWKFQQYGHCGQNFEEPVIICNHSRYTDDYFKIIKYVMSINWQIPRILWFHEEADLVTMELVIDQVLCLIFGPMLQKVAATQLWIPN